MAVQINKNRRSMKSYIVEKLLLLRGTKKAFSSIENTKKLINERSADNSKPYVIEKMKLTCTISEQQFDNMQVFTLNDQNNQSQKVILYIHGGAWTNQPLHFHWLFMDKIAKACNAKMIAPIYPKVPHFNYKHTYPKLLNLYKEIVSAVENHEQITIMGDSAGGNIALSLAQLLTQNHLPQPKNLILLSACVDMGLNNPLIPEYEKLDPMLSVGGMEAITKIWADDKSLDDPLISPIYGDFTGLSKITHFIGTHEGLYPDAIRLDNQLSERGIEIQTYVYPKMNHVFVVMPIPEASDAQQKIIDIIGT